MMQPSPFIAGPRGSGASGAVTIGAAISGGTDTRVLFNDGGVVADNSAFTFTKATGLLKTTALALGGAALGTNVFAATGTGQFSGKVTSSQFVTTDGLFSASSNALYAATAGLVGFEWNNYTTNTFAFSATVPIGWKSAGINGASLDVTLSRNAAGALQVGSTAANRSGSLLMNGAGFVGNKADIGYNSSTAIRVASDWVYGFTSVTTADGTIDTQLARDGAGILAQRNGANAQEFNLYQTYTDASNYVRAEIFASGFLLVGVGTGSGSASSVEFGGGSGSAGNVFIRKANSRALGFNGTLVAFGSSGVDAAFTSSFPALKRSSAVLEAKLADDSGYAAFKASTIQSTVGFYDPTTGIGLDVSDTINCRLFGTTVKSTAPIWTMSGTAIPAGGTAGSGFRLSSATNFGVFFGSGAPTLAAAKGSIYLRSDGSGTGDRAYINTDGGTTWTAITTAA